jgi:hypothetical protein
MYFKSGELESHQMWLDCIERRRKVDKQNTNESKLFTHCVKATALLLLSAYDEKGESHFLSITAF